MPDMSLSMSLEDRQDDLPRTLRRKSLRTADDDSSDHGRARAPEGHVVTDIQVPFGRLVAFFFKAAFAAIPVLLLFAAVLYGIGYLFPSLNVIYFKIGR